MRIEPTIPEVKRIALFTAPHIEAAIKQLKHTALMQTTYFQLPERFPVLDQVEFLISPTHRTEPFPKSPKTTREHSYWKSSATKWKLNFAENATNSLTM